MSRAVAAGRAGAHCCSCISSKPVYVSCQALVCTKSQSTQFVNRQGMLWCQGHTHAHPPAPPRDEWETPCAELPELGVQRRLHKSNPKLPDECSLRCVPAHRCDSPWQVQLGSSAWYYLWPPPAAPQLLFSPSARPGRRAAPSPQRAALEATTSEGVFMS